MSLRQQRIADQIRDIVGKMFQGGQLDDPRLQPVTISYAKVSPDLQIATLYFRLINGDPSLESDVKEALEAASGRFKKQIAKSLDLRRVPHLRFFYDKTIERANNIETLLDQLRLNTP